MNAPVIAAATESAHELLEAEAVAWAELRYAAECIELADIDPAELDRADVALERALEHATRAGLLGKSKAP